MRSEAATAPARDPATLPRLALTAVIVLLLWPGLKLTEFDLIRTR